LRRYRSENPFRGKGKGSDVPRRRHHGKWRGQICLRGILQKARPARAPAGRLRKMFFQMRFFPEISSYIFKKAEQNMTRGGIRDEKR
jgi:hypothetical protein